MMLMVRPRTSSSSCQHLSTGLRSHLHFLSSEIRLIGRTIMMLNNKPGSIGIPSNAPFLLTHLAAHRLIIQRNDADKWDRHRRVRYPLSSQITATSIPPLRVDARL